MPDESRGRGLRVPPQSQRAPWIAAAVLVVVCLGAVLAFVFGGDSGDEAPPDAGDAETTVAQGVACPGLISAQSALQAGDYQEVEASVRDARRDALEALDSSKAKFGKPEHIALTLAARRLGPDVSASTVDWLRQKLGAAENACNGLETS